MIHRSSIRPNSRRRVACLAAALAMASTAQAAAASGGDVFTSGAITVERPWSRATPGGAKVAIGALTLRNAADLPDRLVSVTTDVASHTGPHSMAAVNGVMEMRALPDGIPIPPHGTVVLAPGGDHLMLEGLKHPLKRGDRFSGTLVFERAGPLPVTFTVESIGAKGPGASSPGASGDMMKMN